MYRLVMVLGHDSCGAVQAALSAIDDGVVPGGYVRDIVERVTPSILLGRHAGLTRVDRRPGGTPRTAAGRTAMEDEVGLDPLLVIISSPFACGRAPRYLAIVLPSLSPSGARPRPLNQTK